MSAEYRDKLRTVSFGKSDVRAIPKVTVDDHGRGLSVEVTEHFNDRVDVNVNHPGVRLKLRSEED